jgi:hypothetical protein
MRSGVGAFVGSFTGALDDQGARDFAIAVYRELLRGASVAAALHAARQAGRGRDGATALLYCLYGEGGLTLVQGDGAP